MAKVIRTSRRCRAALSPLVFSIALGACASGPGDSGGLDAGDAAHEAAADGAVNDGASVDSARDASTDVARDASADVMTDAARDAAVDAPTDASVDAARDASVDAPNDAAADAAVALAFPIVDPPPGFTGMPARAPGAIAGATGMTIANVAITNPSGDCLTIHGGSDVVIDHVAIGPCAGAGIVVDGNAQRITIRNSYVHDTTGVGLNTFQTLGVQATGNAFARVASGGYFQLGGQIVFERNAVLDVEGPFPRGQMVQFNGVTGAGNAIRCNILEDRAGESYAEDGINVYQSNGTAASPILVEGNRILGGGPSNSGGGILLGDGAGSYETARDNTVVDPGQYGMSVAGGSHMRIDASRIFARQQPFTNVGLFVWDQYMSSCTDVVFTNNRVQWTNRDGVENAFWNGGNCANFVNTGNVLDDPTLTAAVISEVPASCQ